MSTTEKKTRRNPSFFEKLKAAIVTFLAGAATGGATASYFILNADQYHIPLLSKGNNNTQTTDVNKGVQSSGANTGNVGTNTGTQVGGSNSGNIGNNNTNTTTNGTPGVGNIVTGANAKIDIRITPQDPKFQNDKLPGFFPDQGFTTQPPQLNTFEGASIFTRDLLLNGVPIFSNQNEEVAIRGKAFPYLFYVQGASETQRVAFKLDPAQKGVLLQFGMADLQKGDTNVTYQVSILVDGNRVWAGRVVYGTDQQILSVPLNVPGATALSIEYSTSLARAGDSQPRNLIFTRAEQLFK